MTRSSEDIRAFYSIQGSLRFHRKTNKIIYEHLSIIEIANGVSPAYLAHVLCFHHEYFDLDLLLFTKTIW